VAKPLKLDSLATIVRLAARHLPVPAAPQIREG